ncbi:rRNA maturation RNase YbeY [Limibacter armeniacum]|uniref:rRNA maturation RNase YbeY n=1 Tax=Limibacter armeniacum TaxID=466084 RepID=UPI002FE665D6
MVDNINFFFEDVEFDFSNEEKVKQWVGDTVAQYDFSVDEINYIFCSDEYLYQINVEYLNHDTYTDIITFDNSEREGEILSDIFISVERVKDNASEFNVSFEDELHRVMIHGILHLVGLKDKTDDEKSIMRSTEKKHLDLRSF